MKISLEIQAKVYNFAITRKKNTMNTMMVNTIWWRSYNSKSRKGSKPCIFTK